MSEINFLNIIQVLIAIAMIGFILIQRGPGATAGSAFGGGASGTVFGAKGSGSFLTKATAILATAFFIITMLIAIDSSETYASAGDAVEQDLGVFGSLEDATESGVSAVGDDAAAILDDVISGDGAENVQNAVDAVEEKAANAVDVVEETASAVGESTEDAVEAVEEAIDSDGDGN